MSKTIVNGASQKTFVKIFDSICTWNARWERWSDMVRLFAINIANCTDYSNRDERIKVYQFIESKYKPDEFVRFNDLFNELIESLEMNPFQDFLGAMYMELELGSHWHGQFFTPFNVCRMMAENIVDNAEERIRNHGWTSFHDPACGGGATLIAAANVLHDRDINYQQHALFVGQDLDEVAAMMCYIQLSLLGCAGYVKIGNTLKDPLTGSCLVPDNTKNIWFTPMYFTSVWQGRIMIDRICSAKPKQKERRDKVGVRTEQLSFL